MRSSFTKLLSAGCALLLQAPVFAQGYHVNDVTPIGATSAMLLGVSAGKMAGAAQVAGTSYFHAARFGDNALVAVDDLNKPEMWVSVATSADEFQEGGYFWPNAGGLHAVVWTGASYTDLHPTNSQFSYCIGVHHGEQVGYVDNQVPLPFFGFHAMSWHGSAESVVDLHRPGIGMASQARACRDGEEVGFVASSWDSAYTEHGNLVQVHQWSRAYRWAGTAESGVDLHPAGYDSSEALATSGTRQGGWGLVQGGLHALLWSGDAASVVDLSPIGIFDTRVNAMSKTMQVGEGWIGHINAGVRHALAWTGSADSVVDLNQYLPPGYTDAVATGVGEDGTIVGYAYKGSNFVTGFVQPGGIAVVWSPNPTPAGQVSSIALARSAVGPGAVVQGVVSLGGPAPAGGVNISFISGAPALAAAPAPILIPEGESHAAFALTVGGAPVTVPATFKVYATDGSVSRVAEITVTMVPPFTFVVGAADGGYSTFGYFTLPAPAPAGGLTFALTSGNPAVAAVPSSVTIPQGYASWVFPVNTAPVSAATIVPVNAVFFEWPISTSFIVNPVPALALATLSIPSMIGGQTVTGTVAMTTWHNAGGSVITLTSGDVGALQVPATVTIPPGAASVSFPVTSKVVTGLKGVSVKATFNGGNLTATVNVSPIPTVAILHADYFTDTHEFRVDATTSFNNAVMTFGGSPDAAPFGVMLLEVGVFKGSIFLATAPSQATVWNSLGGQATVAVRLRTSAVVAGGGGTATAYKLTVSTNGKGSVTASPAAASYAPGTVVTLVATPAAGSPWIGWSGAITGTKNPATVTIDANTAVTANFR